MEIEKIEKGQKVKILGKYFIALDMEYEADVVYSKVNPLIIKEYKEIFLHDQKSKSLSATHALRYYLDNKELFLFKLKYENPKPIHEKTNLRGTFISYHNKIKINLKDIN